MFRCSNYPKSNQCFNFGSIWRKEKHKHNQTAGLGTEHRKKQEQNIKVQWMARPHKASLCRRNELTQRQSCLGLFSEAQVNLRENWSACISDSNGLVDPQAEGGASVAITDWALSSSVDIEAFTFLSTFLKTAELLIPQYQSSPHQSEHKDPSVDHKEHDPTIEAVLLGLFTQPASWAYKLKSQSVCVDDSSVALLMTDPPAANSIT